MGVVKMIVAILISYMLFLLAVVIGTMALTTKYIIEDDDGEDR